MTKNNIVISRYNRNVDWIYKIDNVNILIYDKEKPENELNIPVNKGNEASVYLKYIIDNYDILPENTFFIHDEEYSWHHSGSIIEKYNEAIQSNKLYYNINDNCIFIYSLYSHKWYFEIMDWYKEYIEEYIPLKSLHTIPKSDWMIGHRGSAQFLVNKKVILNLPKEFYEKLYNWIITTDMPNEKSGRFLEYTWHLFWDIYPNLP
jgi:hypothetical protein